MGGGSTGGHNQTPYSHSRARNRCLPATEEGRERVRDRLTEDTTYKGSVVSSFEQWPNRPRSTHTHPLRKYSLIRTVCLRVRWCPDLVARSTSLPIQSAQYTTFSCRTAPSTNTRPTFLFTRRAIRRYHTTGARNHYHDCLPSSLPGYISCTVFVDGGELLAILSAE